MAPENDHAAAARDSSRAAARVSPPPVATADDTTDTVRRSDLPGGVRLVTGGDPAAGEHGHAAGERHPGHPPLQEDLQVTGARLVADQQDGRGGPRLDRLRCRIIAHGRRP